MQAKLPFRRYCARDYGGQQFINIPRNIFRIVMFVRGLENPTGGIRFP
jgi:hypothetical protein